MRVPDDAGDGGKAGVDLPPGAVGKRVERQERGAPGLQAIKKRDGALGIFGGRRNDIGESRAECHVHRAGVALVGGDQIRNDAFDAAEFAFLPRLDDGARSRYVSFERVLEFFDSVQARLRGRDFPRKIAVRCDRVGDGFLSRGGVAFGILGASPRFEQLLVQRFEGSPSLAVAVGSAAGYDLDLLGAFPRGTLLAFEALGFGAQRLGAHAPLGFVPGLLGRRYLDFA